MDNRNPSRGGPSQFRGDISDELVRRSATLWVEGKAIGKEHTERGRFEEWIPNLAPAPFRQASSAAYNSKSAQTIFPHAAAPDQNIGPNPADASSSTQLEAGAILASASRRTIELQQENFTQRNRLNPLTARRMMAGRGRGRGAPGGLKGATWEYDASIKLESKPSDLFPAHPNIRKPAPMTAKERREVDNYKQLQDQIHRGPLYTQPTKRDPNAPAKTFGEEQFNRQYGTNRKADMDPFTGVETYSMRYAPKQRDLPNLSNVKFNKELFPRELWSTLEGDEGEEVKAHIARAMQRKAAFIAGAAKGGDMDVDSLPAEDKAKLDAEIKARTDRVALKVASAGDDNEEDEEVPEAEEADDAYEDDDMGDDYNAEGYFDDGEADGEDDGDGGNDDY